MVVVRHQPLLFIHIMILDDDDNGVDDDSDEYEDIDVKNVVFMLFVCREGD